MSALTVCFPLEHHQERLRLSEASSGEGRRDGPAAYSNGSGRKDGELVLERPLTEEPAPSNDGPSTLVPTIEQACQETDAGHHCQGG
jgi:hypothetical protein